MSFYLYFWHLLISISNNFVITFLLEGGGNMAIKLITYDLNKTGQDYSSLYDEIKSLGECINPLDSVWLVQTNIKSTDIRDRLKKVADKNDYFIVVPYANDSNSERAAWLKSEHIKWINNHL
jgi:hypothetical protein